MSITDRTPVKSVIQDDNMNASGITTPQQPNLDESTEDDLMGCFSAMKVSHGGFYKRFAESDTIEGSPVNALRFKKQDIRPTPYKFDNNQFNDDIPKISPMIHEHSLSTKNESLKSDSPKLLVICSASEEHNTGDHQENALRTALLCGPDGCLRRPELAEHIQWINSDSLRPAPMVDLLRVHEYTYLQYIDEKCKAASTIAATAINKNNSNIEGQPMKSLPEFYAPPGMLDSDTPLQVQSLEAAKRFCGAAILAVDHIMQGRGSYTSRSTTTTAVEKQPKQASGCDRAFVIGRPPGHHAGPNGCVPSQYYWLRPDMASSGFCLLNTVAVAAAYARHQYGRWAWRNMTMQANPVIPIPNGVPGIPTPEECRAPKIAIVDIDIHHGNGTEEIVRNLTPHMIHLPLPSSWAPVQALSYKPWLSDSDADEVFFSSVHLYAGERFYPCSGPDTFPAEAPSSPSSTQHSHPSTTSTLPNQQPSTNKADSSEHIVNIALTPLGPGPWDRKARAKLTSAQRDVLCKQASQEFRTKITTMLLPRIASFNADLIFISAGFDAHYDDMYHFLTEEDIHWVTEELCRVASLSGGAMGCGVISVLEGGYSLSSPLPKTKSTRTTATTSTSSASATASINPAVNSTLPISHTTPPLSGTITTTVLPAAAETQLGRGGRQKAKKEKALSTISTNTSTGTNSNTIAAENNLSHTSSTTTDNTVSKTTNPLSFIIPAAVKKENEKFEVPPLAPTTAVHVPSYTSSVCMTGSSEAGTGFGSGMTSAVAQQVDDRHGMFAQRPGDGGLVKGVLAHTAALVGAKHWKLP